MFIAFIHVVDIPQRNEFHKNLLILLFKGAIRIPVDVSCLDHIWRWKWSLVCVKE
jgi:hypothetical protein